MSQTRTHDYGAARTAAGLNRKLARIVPAGVYEGMNVAVNGTISPGMLYSADGVRIEESGNVIPRWGAAWENMGVPPGDPTYPRRDLIVCQYLFEESVPAPEAEYKVISGVPAAEPAYPDIPENSIVLARALMPAGAIVYTEVLQASPPERLVNCVLNPDGTYSVIKGALTALRETFDVNTGVFAIYKRPADTYADGGEIDWEDPMLSLDENGIVQLKALADALAATTPVPGSSMLGVKAKAGANGLLSIANGTLQTALEKLITDGDFGLKALADLINGHVNDNENAHAAGAISFSDTQYTATAVAAALIEMMTGFAYEHSIPKDGVSCLHKTINWQGPATLAVFKKLFSANGLNDIAIHFGGYYDGYASTLAVGASRSATDDMKWSLDNASCNALAIRMAWNTGIISLLGKAAGSAAWGDSSWSKLAEFDIATGAITLHKATTIDGALQTDSITLGDEGPTVTTGVGAPSGTPAYGSRSVRTDAATGHSGVYVYTVIDGWKELAVV
jgi:hypothetical protein